MKNEISNNIEHDASNLPLEVDNYHSLSLLEASSNLPVPSSTTYKATHSSTGIKYCLRRLHGTQVQLNHPTIGSLISRLQVSGFNQ
jgi:PAB-dependent poly(A)-specific ribonuclease subunit 3